MFNQMLCIKQALSSTLLPSTLAILALALIPQSVNAAIPGDACTDTSAVQQNGVYVMICDGANWVRVFEMDSSGNLGVGQESPQAPLHIGGAIILGTSALTCNADRIGGVRYNSSNNNLELCDGTSWEAVSVGACDDATPDSISFTDLVNQSTSTLVTSNIAQITGLSCSVNATTSGEGSPQFRTCSDSSCTTVIADWISTGTVSNGEYIQMRLTTSASDGVTNTSTLYSLDSDSNLTGTQPHQAAEYCEELSENGYTDWYLPASNDLETIYDNNVAIDGFTSSYYWSPSEYNTNAVRVRNLVEGNTTYGNKKGSYPVRCARRD